MLRHPHKIRIGDNVVIDDNCLLDAKGRRNRGITIGSGVFIGRNTILSCKNGDIEIARRREHRLQLRGVLGQPRDDRARHAAGGLLLRDRRRSRLQRSVAARCSRRHAVGAASAIGAGAWLGAGAKILDGVTIGDRAIVGAGAVVRDAVPDGAIAVGIPRAWSGAARSEPPAARIAASARRRDPDRPSS